METFYIAGIVPESAASGGGYSVYFADLPNVAAGGETIAEAIRNAASGLCLAMRGLAAQKAPIPSPSTLAEVREKVRIEREADGLPCPEDTVYQYIPAPSMDKVPVRINISLAKSLLREMDAAADLQGMTRSGFIAEATQEYI
ncbi:MAG: type II toxin-antitoxin system HicB family antitoxin, partial [Desulfovibrio sp.]|nr:type II toxin-antitoxin system HicB family antitoxin [Desulfovibrio sp.]